MGGASCVALDAPEPELWPGLVSDPDEAGTPSARPSENCCAPAYWLCVECWLCGWYVSWPLLAPPFADGEGELATGRGLEAPTPTPTLTPASCAKEAESETDGGREMGWEEVKEEDLLVLASGERSGRQAAAANGPASCIRCASDAGESPPPETPDALVGGMRAPPDPEFGGDCCGGGPPVVADGAAASENEEARGH